MKIGIKVSEAMNKNPVIISPNKLLPFCARKMLGNNIGGILVGEKGKLLGIVTEKDIVEEVVAKELNAQKTKVKEIMSSSMITISPEVDISEAIEIMNREDVRRLPVIKNKKLVGILTQKDLLKLNKPELHKTITRSWIKK